MVFTFNLGEVEINSQFQAYKFAPKFKSTDFSVPNTVAYWKVAE